MQRLFCTTDSWKIKEKKKNEKNVIFVLTRRGFDDRLSLALIQKAKKMAKSLTLERYRSGHNEAVLKTVCPQGRVGSNPTLSVIREKDLGVWRSTQVAEGAPLERE